MITKNATQLNRKANQCQVLSCTPEGICEVKSPSGSTYTVDLSRGGVCTCSWGRKGGAGCSHEMAARKHWARLNEDRTVSFQAGDAGTVARKQHKATAPVAVGKDGAVTMVLRNKADPVVALDAEIRDLGERLAEARHRRLMTSDGQVRADARAEMEQLREQLMDRQVARERAVADRAAA